MGFLKKEVPPDPIRVLTVKSIRNPNRQTLERLVPGLKRRAKSAALHLCIATKKPCSGCVKFTWDRVVELAERLKELPNDYPAIAEILLGAGPRRTTKRNQPPCKRL